MLPPTLKKRREFLRIRGGARWASTSFVLETKPRPVEQATATAGSAERRDPGPPRFGFTVTKKLGTAVTRNRIRRRLKAAVGLLAADHARAGHDYVLVARAPAEARPFADLKKELEDAFHRVHHAGKRPRLPREP